MRVIAPMIIRLIPAVTSPASYPAHEWVSDGLARIAHLQILLEQQREAVKRKDHAEAFRLNKELLRVSRDN